MADTATEVPVAVGKVAQAASAYWANMTPEERSAEMARRRKVAAKRGKVMGRKKKVGRPKKAESNKPTIRRKYVKRSKEESPNPEYLQLIEVVELEKATAYAVGHVELLLQSLAAKYGVTYSFLAQRLASALLGEDVREELGNPERVSALSSKTA